MFKPLPTDEQGWIPYYVTAGQPANSRLWNRLSKRPGDVFPADMPLGSMPLPAADLTTIYDWILGLNQTTLGNASTRLFVQTGPDIGIAGFIVAGQPQKVVIRGLGPTLSQFGVQGILADPKLLLFNAAHEAIASNDNWQTTVINGAIVSNQVDEIRSSGFAPLSANESVIIATLPAGNYTAQLQDATNATGVALVEVYPLAQLTNISTRGLVQTGGNIMIGGFIITGQPRKVVIRGLGPTLSQFGVQGILADPKLSLFNEADQLIASNDDWVTGDQWEEIQSSGFGPSFPLESALITTLPPGNYTAQLQGYNNTTGVALVEVYTLP